VEHLGLREDLVHPDAQKLRGAQMLPNTDTTRALAPHGTHRDLPRPGMTSQDHHDRYPFLLLAWSP
jgi:hypothetical protein